VLPEVPCHITQRGVDRCDVFSADQDRTTYLRLLHENLTDAGVRVLGYWTGGPAFLLILLHFTMPRVPLDKNEGPVKNKLSLSMPGASVL